MIIINFILCVLHCTMHNIMIGHLCARVRDKGAPDMMSYRGLSAAINSNIAARRRLAIGMVRCQV